MTALNTNEKKDFSSLEEYRDHATYRRITLKFKFLIIILFIDDGKNIFEDLGRIVFGVSKDPCGICSFQDARLWKLSQLLSWKLSIVYYLILLETCSSGFCDGENIAKVRGSKSK